MQIDRMSRWFVDKIENLRQKKPHNRSAADARNLWQFLCDDELRPKAIIIMIMIAITLKTIKNNFAHLPVVAAT